MKILLFAIFLQVFVLQPCFGAELDTNAVSADIIAKDLGVKGAKAIYLLAFISMVDDRPLYVDSALVTIQLSKNRWRLIHAVRNPNDRVESVQKWSEYFVNDSKLQGALDFRHIPTKTDVENFIQISGWRFRAWHGFRLLKGEVYSDAWKRALGIEPKHKIVKS